MSSLLEGGEHLERELTPEPVAGAGDGLDRAARRRWRVGIVLYYVLGGFFHSQPLGRLGGRAERSR